MSCIEEAHSSVWPVLHQGKNEKRRTREMITVLREANSGWAGGAAEAVSVVTVYLCLGGIADSKV